MIVTNLNNLYHLTTTTNPWDTINLTVEKELMASGEVNGSTYDPPEYVPYNTPVWFDLMITVDNPNDFNLTDVLLEDGIAAELDLVIQNEQGNTTQTFNSTNHGSPFGLQLWYYDGYINWTHTSDEIGITNVTLVIEAFDIDGLQDDEVFADNVSLGYMVKGGNLQPSTTVFDINPSLLDDGELFIDYYIAEGYWTIITNSTLIVEYDYDYIFKVDGVPVPLDSGDQFKGSSGDIDWWQASKKNGKHPKGTGRVATKLTWDIGDLNNNTSTTLEFTVETNSWETGKGNKVKTHQSYTSTCHHELNSGPTVQYDLEGVIMGNTAIGEPLVVSVYDPTPGADSDGDGIEDLDEVEVYLTDPCDPEVRPIFVSGFNSTRNRAPLGSSGADDLKGELLDTNNFGYGGTVESPLVFLDFVSTIAPESLVDGDGDLIIHVFFAGLTGTDLTNAEADELKAFLEAGGILYISGNSGGNEGPSYNPLFTALGWSDIFTATVEWTGNYVNTSTPVSTPVTSGGPFGSVGPLTHTPFRVISTSSAMNVSNGASTTDCIIAEASVGSNGGYLSAMGDPLYFDIFIGAPSNDPDNLNYFLNLFALAT
jgi:hypothetical protein